MKLFRRHSRKTFLQVKPHLITKEAQGSRSGPVIFPDPLVPNLAH